MFTDQDILDFWFKGVAEEKPLSNKILIVNKWFKSDEIFDLQIREKFFPLFEASVLKAMVDNINTPRERLAKIILFDQFPRNMFRNTPKMFFFDSIALKTCLDGLKNKEDWSLKLYERIFFYMPLMHAENIKMQEQSVKRFEELWESSKIAAKHSTTYYASNLKSAREHFEIIKNFGRFPSRNKILNRTSTKEEEIFLNQK